MSQNWYQKATVQAAISGAVVAGIFGIIITIIGLWGNSQPPQQHTTNYNHCDFSTTNTSAEERKEILMSSSKSLDSRNTLQKNTSLDFKDEYISKMDKYCYIPAIPIQRNSNYCLGDVFILEDGFRYKITNINVNNSDIIRQNSASFEINDSIPKKVFPYSNLSAKIKKIHMQTNSLHVLSIPDSTIIQKLISKKKDLSQFLKNSEIYVVDSVLCANTVFSFYESFNIKLEHTNRLNVFHVLPDSVITKAYSTTETTATYNNQMIGYTTQKIILDLAQ